MADIKGLVDSGATDNFIRPAFAKRMGLGLQTLERPKKIWNIDNTENQAGSITHFIDLDVQTKGNHRTMRFLVTNIGDEDLVLGYPWLATYEPTISWTHATIHEDILPIILRSINPTEEQTTIAAVVTEESKEQIIEELEEECQLRTTATELAIAAKKDITPTAIPAPYQRFAKLFSEEASH